MPKHRNNRAKATNEVSSLLNMKLLTMTEDFEPTQGHLYHIDTVLRDIALEYEISDEEVIEKVPESFSPNKDTVLQVESEEDEKDSDKTIRRKQQFLFSFPYQKDTNSAHIPVSSFIQSYLSNHDSGEVVKKPCSFCNQKEISQEKQLANLSAWRKYVRSKLQR